MSHQHLEESLVPSFVDQMFAERDVKCGILLRVLHQAEELLGHKILGEAQRHDFGIPQYRRVDIAAHEGQSGRQGV